MNLLITLLSILWALTGVLTSIKSFIFDERKLSTKGLILCITAGSIMGPILALCLIIDYKEKGHLKAFLNHKLFYKKPKPLYKHRQYCGNKKNKRI